MNDIPESAVAGEPVAQGSGRKRLNPATWTRRTKLIAGGAALALVLAGTGGGIVYHQYAIDRDCQAQTELFGNQKTELTKAVKDAEAALALVEGDTPADHTTGFTEWNRDIVPTTESTGVSADDAQSDASQSANTAQSTASASADENTVDGKTLTADLKKAIDTAKKHSKEAVPQQCSTSDDLDAIEALTSSRQADLDALTAQTKTFTVAVDAYRLKTASTEATSSMDTAKTDLAAAQKDATDQLAVVDGDTALQSDATVKAAYDALKKTENDSHSVSTTVTTSTYDEAVASIDKAKTVAAKTAEVSIASQALKNAIQAYRDAKAVETTAAQATSEAATSNYTSDSASDYSWSGGESSYSDYSGGYSGGSSYSGSSGGGSYSAPAPAPSNNSGSSSGSGGDTMIDWGDTSGELDTTPGKCWYIEGQAYCN